MNSWGISSSTITLLRFCTVCRLTHYNSNFSFIQILIEMCISKLRTTVILGFKWDRKTFSKVCFYLFFAKLCLTRIWHVVNYVLQGFPYDGNFRYSWPDNRHYLCYANVDIVQLHWVKKKVDFHHIPFLRYYVNAWLFQSSTFIVKWWYVNLQSTYV